MTRDFEKINRAIEMAARAHRWQKRKGTAIPYVTHPFAVGLLLLEAGCQDEVVISGLLHDTLEDTFLKAETIREHFGPRVTEIVEACSEDKRSFSWEKRKQLKLAGMHQASLDVKLVTCADAFHNILTIAREFGRIGEKIWKRFRRGRREQEWFYRQLLLSLESGNSSLAHHPLFQQLKKEVEIFFSPGARSAWRPDEP